MKSNDALNNSHHSGVLLHADLGPFAQYFVKFLQAYAAAGIKIGAITPQNEPGNATQYPGMELPADREARLIASWLKPALSAAGLHPRIYGNDQGWSHGRDRVHEDPRLECSAPLDLGVCVALLLRQPSGDERAARRDAAVG